jgi:hypothetical protein
MSPSQIACRSCAQQPNEPCWDYGRDCQYMIASKPAFHQERILDADSMDTGGNVSAEEFDKAVQQSGLI